MDQVSSSATPESKPSAEAEPQQFRRRRKVQKSGCDSERARKFAYDWYGPFPHIPEAPFLQWPKLLLWEAIANWKAGMTVALVSIPLSISLALAAQATPVMGIVTAVWAGMATAALGGSDYNICGPTGALSGILATYSIQYGVQVLPLLAFVAGVLMLIVTALRLDIYVMFIPSAVMEGFSLAVAIIIAGNQLQLAFGLPRGIPKHEEFYMNLYESIIHLGHANGLAAFLFIITTALLFLLIWKAPTIPWSVVMAVLSILLGMAADAGHLSTSWTKVQTLNSRYGSLEPRLFDFALPSFPAPRDEYTTQVQTFWDIMYASVSVGFVAVLETLISARIADRLTATKFAQPREVLAGAVANLLCGVFGGVPATAALARTALNVKSGATSRMAGITSAIAILIISLALLNYFRFLQLPVVAAILVVVAVRMVELKQLHHMYLYDKKTFGIAMFTAAVCIIKDPTDGIMLGGVLSLFIYAKANSQAYGEVEVAVSKEERITSARSAADVDEETAEKALQKLTDSYKRMLIFKKNEAQQHEEEQRQEEDTLIYKFPSELTYLNAPAHIDRAKALHSKFAHVILSCRSLYYIDIDGVEALNDIIGEFERHNKMVLLAAVRDDVKHQMRHTRFFDSKLAAGQVLPTEVECLHYIAECEQQKQAQIVEEGHSYVPPPSDDEDTARLQLGRSASAQRLSQYTDDEDSDDDGQGVSLNHRHNGGSQHKAAEEVDEVTGLQVIVDKDDNEDDDECERDDKAAPSAESKSSPSEPPQPAEEEDPVVSSESDAASSSPPQPTIEVAAATAVTATSSSEIDISGSTEDHDGYDDDSIEESKQTTNSQNEADGAPAQAPAQAQSGTASRVPDEEEMDII